MCVGLGPGVGPGLLRAGVVLVMVIEYDHSHDGEHFGVRGRDWV